MYQLCICVECSRLKRIRNRQQWTRFLLIQVGPGPMLMVCGLLGPQRVALQLGGPRFCCSCG